MKIRMKADILCLRGMEFNIDNEVAKYFIKLNWADEIKEPEFVPYKEPKLEWIGQLIKPKDGLIPKQCKINSIYYTEGVEGCRIRVVHMDGYMMGDCDLNKMFDDYTWLDGSPFGEQAGGE